MKQQITMKMIKALYKNIIKVGYADIQNITDGITADYYTCGVYGWNADIYRIDTDTVIVTGYRPFGNIYDWDTIKKYNQLGRECKSPYSQYKLLQKFATEMVTKFA